MVKKHIMVFHIPYLEWFKKNGYETYVCARNDYDNKEGCIIPYCDKYFDLPFERSPLKLNNIKVYKQLKGLIDGNKFDIIHCHTPMGGALTRLASRDARKKGTSVIYTAHGFHFYKGAPILNWLLYFPIEKWLSKYTDVLITINKEDYTRAMKSFKAQDVKYVRGVGIDTKKFTQLSIDKKQKRKSINVPENAFIIVSVGEVNKNKNHSIVIKALAKLNRSDIYYVICGQGPLESYLYSLAAELKIEKQIKLLGFRRDVNEICQLANIFVFPSFREGLSVALMEAMAAGLPVVCSDIRGNSDLIEDEKGGFLVDPYDVDNFANALEKVYKSQKLRNFFSQNNTQHIKNYSLEIITDQMSKIYEKCSDK